LHKQTAGAKHLAFVREILRFAQNDTPHFICDRPLVLFSKSCGGDVQEFAVFGDGAPGKIFDAGFGQLFAYLVVI